jgi:serine/threonine protein phosphatase 1
MLGFLGRTWRPELPEGRRVYAIGDVHGRLDLFTQLLDMIRRDDATCPPAETHLIQLGDLVDRGPDSAGVVALAMGSPDFASLTVLQGNHEAMMIAALHGDRDALRGWLRFGGRETLLSWGVPAAIVDGAGPDALLDAARVAIPEAQLDWIASRPRGVQLGDYYFVHAGVRPRTPLDKQSDADRLWIREPFLSSTSRHFAMIVHGHSIVPEVEQLPNRIGIDTGAYSTGRLTALGLHGRHQWIIQTSGPEGT